MRPVPDAEAHLAEVAVDGTAATGAVVFPAELPVFTGHFPGNPVVPGVYVLGAMLALARTALARPALAIVGVDRVKWPRVSLPGDRVELAVTWSLDDDGTVTVDGTARNGGAVACRARFTCR